jgi:hypothetical protein
MAQSMPRKKETKEDELFVTREPNDAKPIESAEPADDTVIGLTADADKTEEQPEGDNTVAKEVAETKTAETVEDTTAEPFAPNEEAEEAEDLVKSEELANEKMQEDIEKNAVKVEEPKEKTLPKKRANVAATGRFISREGEGELSSEVLRGWQSADKDEQKYRELSDIQKKKKVLLGEVSGVDCIESANEVMITVTYNGIRVLIPDSEYFEARHTFSKKYETMTPREKMKSRELHARFNLGSVCPFIIRKVEKLKIEEGRYAGQYEVVAVASRIDALKDLRKSYFFSDPASTPKPGDYAPANILYVGENGILVECLGVETFIDAYNSREGYTENCMDWFRVGEQIPVRIKKVYLNGDDVYMSVSGRLNMMPKSFNSIHLNSTYIGYVDSVNKEKGLYTIIIDGYNVKVAVLFSAVQGHVELNNGDRVAVKIKDIIEDGYCRGLAMKN